MIRDFHLSRPEVLDQLGLDEAFALQAWNTESNPWCAVRRITDGYVAQEAHQ
jgi:hypothetical protein